MASSSPGVKDAKKVCVIGLAPIVASKTAKDEECLLQSFCSVLCEYNTNPLLKIKMNMKFKIRISETKFSYFEGDQFVTAEFKPKSEDQVQKLQTCLEDNTLSTFLAEFLDSTGMSIDLGLDVKEKMEIVAFRIDKVKTEESIPESVESTKEAEVPGCKKDKAILIRIYVPFDVCEIFGVRIVWKDTFYETSNIPGTLVWTVEIDPAYNYHEFLIEVSLWKSSGALFFKKYYTEKLRSSVVKHADGKTVYHLAFQCTDTESRESAFIAFCNIILHQETYKNNHLAFVQLEALNAVTPVTDMNVAYSQIRYSRLKDVISCLIKSLPTGIHAGNLPAFCYILYQISQDPTLISKRELVDEQTAKGVIKWYTTLRPVDELLLHIDKVAAVLQQIYICGLGKKACLIGFIGQALTFLREDFLVRLVQNAVSKSNPNMQFYSPASDIELETILLKLMEKSMQSLLEKILRHIIPLCTLERYVSSIDVLLANTNKNMEIYEKLTDFCKQKCSQVLGKISKSGDLKELLECWTTIQTANLACLHKDLQQTVEKGIFECLKTDSKLSSISRKNELLHAVLHGSLCSCSEEKTELLKLLADAKKGIIRSCVIDLLADDKFHTLPDDIYMAVVKKWLQNTIHCERKNSPAERIVKIYCHLNSVLELPPVQRNKGLHSHADQLVFNAIEKISFRDLMTAVSEIEKNEQLHKLFQNHVRRILHGKHSRNSPTDIIRDICGTTRLRLQSRLSTTIVTDIVDLLGVGDNDSPEKVFLTAVDHSSFWTEVFNAEGSNVCLNALQINKSFVKVADSITHFQKIIKDKKLDFSLQQKLKSKEDDMLNLLSCKTAVGNGDTKPKIENTKPKIEKYWMACYNVLSKFHENINVILEIFRALQMSMNTGNMPAIVASTLEFLLELQNRIVKDEVLVVNMLENETLSEYIKDTAVYCKLLKKPIKSQVFWNILHDELRDHIIEETTESVMDGDGDPLDGTTLPHLFGEEVENESTTSFRSSASLSFISHIYKACIEKYRQVWTPYFKQENRPLNEFKMIFAKIKTQDDMEEEITVAENFCNSISPPQLRSTLLKFADLMSYSKTVDAVTNSLKVFKFHKNVDTYTPVVASFHKLFKVKRDKSGNLDNMFLKDMEDVLEKVEGIRMFISTEVTEILEVLKTATLLLSFLEEVIDEDIRNLIDAVEEHSEQYVRESTVSDLIEVKRFFYPILKKTYGDDLTDLFALLNKQLQGGFTKMPAKIHDCMENLHTLRALYKNVANRGERTKEIIESIVNRGRFHFQMDSGICDIIVKYKQGKRTASHTGSDLHDLRSRALLLLNAEDRKKSGHKTMRKKEDIEKFLLLVDTAFNISSICLQLKQSGHFDFSRYEHSCDQKELAICSQRLAEEYEEWTNNLVCCREDYYFMNFIYPSQLQQLFEYLCKNHGNDKMVLTTLQFIDRPFDDVCMLKERFKALPPASNNKDRLLNIAVAVQSIFQSVSPVEKVITTMTKQPNIADVVQHGIPYIAALDEESPLVIRTMLALYINTTNMLPKASQVLFCRGETSLDDIDLFLRRCIKDVCEVHLYCIANVEMLSNFVLNKFVEILHQLPSEKYLLSLICCGHAHHPFLDQFADRISRPTPTTETSLKYCLRKHWPDVLVISSDVPGLGKTEMVYIRARQKGMCVATLHVSGKVDIQAIIHNLNNLQLQKFHVLHIDIGITHSPSDLDSMLFQLIVLGYLSSGSMAYTLTTNHVTVEISNTVQQSVCNSLPTTTCFSRLNIKWNNYKDMKVCADINSPTQVVCNYLRALENGTVDRTDIYFTGTSATMPLKADECISILSKHFSSASDMSYTLLQIFLNVLSDQLKKLSASVFFRTANIAAMVGDDNVGNVKSNLVKALVNASQEFACRSVQSCRSLQAASLVPMSNVSTSGQNTAEELAQRVGGMIRWEDSNHLMVLFHQNVQTVSALYRDKTKIPDTVQTLFKTQMKKSLDDFRSKTQRELQDILQMLTRSKAKKLSDEYLQTIAVSYALTPDNLLKMVLISLRINSHIPVVIMGETGCGKTSLVRYLAGLCEVNFEALSIHAGTDENTIVQKIKESNDNAIVHLDTDYWLFLDEINTCDHLGIINSILCHRYFQGETLAPNVSILAACNPYRLRTQSTIFTSGLQGKVKTDELSRLVYRVHPLPESLLDFVWDYGSLNEEDEKFYISKMVKSIFDGYDNATVYERLLTNLLAMSQNFVREIEKTGSCVSLRDVDRCRKLVIWFLQFLKEKKTKTSFAYGIEVKAIVLAIGVTYHSRFIDVEKRTNYRVHISHIVSTDSRPLCANTVLEIIRDEQNDILDRMVLPSGIAKNTALQENVFVVLICILTKIPIFLVGKPGCSKSLSMQLIRSNLRGKDSKNELFQRMPQLFCVSFQGSESSTSDGILKVFEKAENYQKHNEKEVISVVILDEIGLAEVSRFNPLKVLHGLLEPGNQQTPNVAVVGISNWALDAAKMNRAVHLSRPDMDLDELKYTGNSISAAIVDAMHLDQELDADDSNKFANIREVFKHLFGEIAVAYFKYVSERQKFANFHGLRDYYSLIKYIGRCIFKNGEENMKTEVILTGIARNFGGLPSEMVGIVEIFQESFPNLEHTMISVNELIKDNLNDDSCRHLMLITNGDSVISVLESHLNQTCRPFEIIFGSHFDDDLSDDYNYRILSRIILCMEQGLVLILKGLESIYGSLYDMLNQNYTVVGNKKNCRIALGHYSNPMCHVHDSFKCIVLVEERKLDYSDPPFLNRFEKQQFRFSDLIEHDQIGGIITEIEDILKKLCDIKGYRFCPENVIPSYNRDLIVSLILHLRKTEMQLQNPSYSTDGALQLLLWIIPPEVMVRAKESHLYDSDASRLEKMIEFYMTLPVHEGLAHCLNVILNPENGKHGEHGLGENRSKGKLLLLYTFTNIHVNIRACLNAQFHQLEKLSSFKSEKQLSNKVEEFFASEKTVLLLQCSAVYDSHHLLLSKVIIENIRRKTGFEQKHVCMIVHLDRGFPHEQQYVPINYLSEWKMIFLDSLEKPVTTISHFMESTKHEIVQERRPLDAYIVDNLFWALTRIKFTDQNNYIENQKRLIEQLRKNEFAICTIEQLIVRLVEEQSYENDEQWCVNVAKNTHELYKSGTLVGACETSIHDIIKTPLAMYLYQLLELQMLSPAFIEDVKSSQRLQVWKEIVMSNTYVNIRDMPPVTGPECYLCSASFLTLKMPLSHVLMGRIESQKDHFLEIIRKLRIQNDIESDEDIPNELFVKIVTDCIDIICSDIDDAYNVQYEKREDDYIHDFCSVYARSLTNIIDEDKARKVFKWAIYHFINSTDFQEDDLFQVMASIHAASWLNAEVIRSMCHLCEISEQILDIPEEQVNDSATSETAQENANDDQEVIHEHSRVFFVDSLCYRLLPTKATIDQFPSISAWIYHVRKIIPVANVVSYESTAMPALQLCHEIVSLIVDVADSNLESVLTLAELLKENHGQIYTPPVFGLIISILNDLHQRSNIHKSRLQKCYCYYILKSLLMNPDDTHVLEQALNLISEGTVLDERMAYFGKCIDFIMMLESAENDNLITEIILDSIEEMPPFVECLDTFLQTSDVTSKSTNMLTNLLVDSVQKTCLQHLRKKESLLEIDSVSHHTISCFLKAFDIIGGADISFKFVAAVAFIRQFLQTFLATFEEFHYDTSELSIVAQHVNTILSIPWNKTSEHISVNPLLLYFMKLVVNRYGTEKAYKLSKRVRHELSCLEHIDWKQKSIESFMVLNPIEMHVDQNLHSIMTKQIDCVLEKENSFEELLDDTESSVMTLFGILSQRFYMRRWLKELSDNESRMAIKIDVIVKRSKLPDKCKHVAKYLVGEEFGHDFFSMSEATESPIPQIVSVLLHLCCLIATSADDTSIWYANFYHPKMSSTQFFPCCSLSESSQAEQKVLRMLNVGTLLGSIGFHHTTENALKTFYESLTENYFQSELFDQFNELQNMLQLNSSDLCIILHCVIMKCEALITHESDYQQLNTMQQRRDLQLRYTAIMAEILENRWQIILNVKKKQYDDDESLGCIESQIDELVTPSCENANKEFTYQMFRITKLPTRAIFFSELHLGCKQEFVFLHLVKQNVKRLSAPQFIPTLMRWHMSVTTHASYKFRKVELKDLTVQKFFSQEIDDKRRNLLKKHFEQFKQAWNEIRDQYIDVVEDIEMEPMNQMVKMETCTVWNDKSILYSLLCKLVDINNSFLDQAVEKIEQSTPNKMLDICSRTLSLLNIKRSDVVIFVWKNDWLRFCQCETDNGLGQKTNFDFEMIEEEIKKDMLYGKVKIKLPVLFPKPTFIDDLFQNSVELLSEIEAAISQQRLTTEITRSVERKMDRDASFVTDLLTHLGMVLSLLKKTAGDNSQPLVEYLEKWQSVTNMNSNIFKRILPEPIDSVKLCHVVTLYKWLEELNGISLVETLDERYLKSLPQEGKDILKAMKQTRLNHLEKLEHPLLVFVHRCLSTNTTNINTEQPLVDYIDTPALWWKEDLDKNGVNIVAGTEKTSIPIRDMLSPLILVENVFETVSFIQNAIKEARESDVLVTSITNEFQKTKTVLPKISRKTKARRIMKI